MYEKYYGLTEKPFSIQPDPEFIYWGHYHRHAFAMLEYSIINNAAFSVITGEAGIGKTTLIRHLLNKLKDRKANVGLLSHTTAKEEGLLQWLMMALGQPFEEQPYVALYERFQKALIDEYANDRKTIIIIDEAQNFGPKSLEELRMLSNINADKDQLLQLILVGQPQLKDLLQLPELTQFAQRVSSDIHLRPLNQDEVVEYIKHRLHVAGRDRALFTPAACQRVFDASRGIPRIINILCDTALIYGFAGEAEKITVKIIHSVRNNKAKYGVFSLYGDKMKPTHLKQASNIQNESDSPVMPT
jgi:general secretion pathway protein A